MYKTQNYSVVPQASLTGPSFCTIQVCPMVSINLYWQDVLEESHVSAFQTRACTSDITAAGARKEQLRCWNEEIFLVSLSPLSNRCPLATIKTAQGSQHLN